MRSRKLEEALSVSITSEGDEELIVAGGCSLSDDVSRHMRLLGLAWVGSGVRPCSNQHLEG